MCKGRNPQRYGDDTEKTCVASLHHGRRVVVRTGRGEDGILHHLPDVQRGGGRPAVVEPLAG